MLYGDEPLLDFPPGRQEDPAIVLKQPVCVAVPVVNAEETAVVADRFGANTTQPLAPTETTCAWSPARLIACYARHGPQAKRLYAA